MIDYQPIACALHSEYELAIMHRQKLQLKWHDAAGVTHSAIVLPLDLQTKNREEFLLVAYDGRHESIRLDRITDRRVVE